MEKQLRWQYSFNGAVQTPAKLTATAAVALKEQQESGAEGIEPFSSETLAPAMESIPSGEESSFCRVMKTRPHSLQKLLPSRVHLTAPSCIKPWNS